MRDAWRLAVGTFTALPSPPPTSLDSRALGGSMLLAPLTTIPAAVVWVGLAFLTTHALLPYAVAAVLALLTTALVSRALHLDGLADLADGLTSGHDRDRSLAVMRRGDTGPAGAASIVLVLLLDAACLASLLSTGFGAVLAVTALVASRLAPAICARHGIPAARADGLGQGVAGTVPRAALFGLVAVVALVTGVGALLASGVATWRGVGSAVVVILAAATGAIAVRRRAVTRLGGVTGDVIGAALEVALAAALVVASALHLAA